MFSIKCTDDSSVKMHFASSSDVAQEVCYDLSGRFGQCEIIQDSLGETRCTWDPGGCLLMGDKEFVFDLGSMKLLCKAQHFNCLLRYLGDTEERGVTHRYYKLHGAYICICFSPEEFAALKKEASETKYLDDADASWAKRNNAVGDIINLQSPGAYDKRELN
jgi:hypothetical protein